MDSWWTRQLREALRSLQERPPSRRGLQIIPDRALRNASAALQDRPDE
jgi:hypothetical protein